MKKVILLLLIVCSGLTAIAQDINLSDSVIYFNNKPVAYYVKTLNESDPHYNIYIISLDMQLLMAAKVIKFEAPVRELKPFYYYDLILQNEKDTLAMYNEGQAFPLELASLLKDYKLLDGNTINKNAWRKFKTAYSGNAALKAKIKQYETYLIDTRYFDEQTIRDRTKSVTIINDKILMQDGKKIGLVVTNTNIPGGGLTTSYSNVITRDNTVAVQIDTKESNGARQPTTEYIQILLPTNRVVDASGVIIDTKDRRSKHSNPPALFELSLPLNKEARNEDLLWKVCEYIKNYLL